MISKAVELASRVGPWVWAAAPGRRPLAGAALLTLLGLLALALVALGLILVVVRWARRVRRGPPKPRHTDMKDIWFLNPPGRPDRRPDPNEPPE